MANSIRRNELLDYIMEHGSAQIDELIDVFRVSRMTVHRDLDALARQGVVRKVRGGATALPSGLFESNFRYRIRTSVDHKKALAKAALHHIEPGQSILLDDSTTVVFLAELLSSVKPLTVVTNGLASIDRLCEAEEVTLIGLGGHYSRNFRSFLGRVCEQAIGSLRVNTLFMSVAAVSGNALYHQDEQVVKVKRAMMAAADRRVLMVDHRKFDTTALNRLGELSEFDLVLVTEGLAPQILSDLQESGVNVRLVSV